MMAYDDEPGIAYNQISLNTCKICHTLFYNSYKYICLQISRFLYKMFSPQSLDHFGCNFHINDGKNTANCIPRTKYVRGILWFSRRYATAASAAASADTSSFSR